MIRSFGNRDTERLWRRQRVRSLDPRIQHVALRLERLKGDRAGQYSIRVNGQWRICFRGADAGPEEVEIVDYH